MGYKQKGQLKSAQAHSIGTFLVQKPWSQATIIVANALIFVERQAAAAVQANNFNLT